jgi:TolB-like protein
MWERRSVFQGKRSIKVGLDVMVQHPITTSFMSASIVSLVALFATTSTSAAKDMRVVVLDLKAAAELGPVAHRITDRILLHLGQKQGIKAIGEAEVGVLVGHAEDKKELTACESDECLEDVSRATEAHKLVSGQIGRLGEGYLVTLSLIDFEKKAVERGESASGDSEADLAAALGPALDRLLGLSLSAEKRAVVIGAQGVKVAVLELAAHGAEPALAGNLTQLLALELKKLDGVSVISRDDIKAMLEYEAQKQIAQCKSDVACLIEIGGALGVELLVTGAVGKLEDTYVITLKLMDIQKAEVVARVAESYRGPERQLTQAIRFAARELFSRPFQGRGEVLISTEASPAEATIDGGDPVPVPHRIEGLAAGKHALATIADGYRPHFEEFYVEPGSLTKVRPDLIEVPVKWYERWWAWAVIGTVAVAATTAVIAASGSPDNGGVDVILRK